MGDVKLRLPRHSPDAGDVVAALNQRIPDFANVFFALILTLSVARSDALVDILKDADLHAVIWTVALFAVGIVLAASIWLHYMWLTMVPAPRARLRSSYFSVALTAPLVCLLLAFIGFQSMSDFEFGLKLGKSAPLYNFLGTWCVGWLFLFFVAMFVIEHWLSRDATPEIEREIRTRYLFSGTITIGCAIMLALMFISHYTVLGFALFLGFVFVAEAIVGSAVIVTAIASRRALHHRRKRE